MFLKHSLLSFHLVVALIICSYDKVVEAFVQRGPRFFRSAHATSNVAVTNLNLLYYAGRCRNISHRCFSPGLRASSDNNSNNNNGDWFFKRPILDSPRSQLVEDKTSRMNSTDLDISKIATLLKGNAQQQNNGIREAKKVKIEKPQIARRTRPSSPLAELEETRSTFPDLQNPQTIFGIAALAGIAAVSGISFSLGLTVDDFMHGAQTLVTDPQAFSKELIEGVQALGPTGAIYYALIYMIAEILAIPATPLTLSAGYLFGLQQGILSVLAGATGAACIGFWISRTFLRDYVESTLLAPSLSKDGVASPNTLTKLDKAIGKDGFKLLVLIRLSPIFPFSVTNYLYGASSMDFVPYLLGTLIGFVPTTTAYVYTGMIGQALSVGQGGDHPWYAYAGGFAALALLVKLVTDVATGIIEAIDE